MSDEVKEVRWCACGLQLGHQQVCRGIEVIGEEERVDMGWEEDEARERQEQFEATRRKAIARRRSQRAVRSLLERHQAVMAELVRLSTVGAGSVAPGRGGGHDSADLQSLRRAAQEPDTKHADDLMDLAVSAYEAILDEELGLGAARDFATMTKEEKDRIIVLELEDWLPAKIELVYRGQLGEAEYVRRLRKKTGRNPRTGRPLRYETHPNSGHIT